MLSVACHPDGSAFATGSSDARVKLWDLQTRTCAQTVTEHTDQARPPDPARRTAPQLWPSRLHVCGDAALRAAGALTRAHTQLLLCRDTCAHTMRSPSSESVSACQLVGSRDGETARCCSRAGWPAGPERRARAPQVWGVAWQAGGSYLASASDDKSVAVYDFS